ncbi:MAG: NAD(P)H-hydrate dehydratase [Woeseia sp.]
MNNPTNTPEQGIFSVADVRAVDSAAIAGGISGIELMTRAAQFAVEIALSEYPKARCWQVLCGAGNNAGDGYLLAKLASEQGIDVSVRYVVSPDTLRGDARTAWQAAVGQGVPIAEYDGSLFAGAGLLIDALLGSGLDRKVSGRYAEVVSAINEHGAPCLALDIPTGLNGDSGNVMGVAVEAATTVTFVGRTTGLYWAAGPDHCGDVRFSSLGIPNKYYPQPRLRLADSHAIRAALPPRKQQAHKGDHGHVLIVGGGKGMPGAARLAGEAALRSGAGRVSVATHAGNTAAIVSQRPELMCHEITASDLAPLFDAATVIAVGPGLGTNAWAQAVFTAARATTKPQVLDADALNLLALAADRNEQRVLTPHPGEAARLLNCSASEVQADRLATLHALQERYAGTVILKGCGSLVSSGDGVPWLCPAGNPGMATAGMGDVLTGIVAGIMAQGATPDTAAVVATVVHALAGDSAAVRGQRGLLASDLLHELRPCLNP